MNIFNFLNNKKVIFTGVLDDTRTENEKLKDWTHEELIGYGAPVSWEEREPKKYPVRNQDGSGACGAFSSSVALGRNEEKESGKYVNLSPAFIYQKRSNKDGAGMNIADMMEILKTHGSPLDEDLSDDNKDDKYLDSKQFNQYKVEEAKKYRAKNYVYMSKDINEMARVISEGKTPILLLRCGIKEWITTPQLIKNTREINHYVPCVDFVLIDGVKYIVVQDSWGWSGGKNGYRFLSEEFIKNRVELVVYTIDLENTPIVEPITTKPVYYFKSSLEKGTMNNEDVKALQRILKYEGCMDQSVPSTGNYLNMTCLAVKKLQLKNQIASVKEIESLQGARCGSKTLFYLNRKYA